MKWYALSGFICAIAAALLLAAIYHDLHPAPQPIAPTHANLVYSHRHDFEGQSYYRIDKAEIGDHVWEPIEGERREQLLVRACKTCGLLKLELVDWYARKDFPNAIDETPAATGDVNRLPLETTNAVFVFQTNAGPTFAAELRINDTPTPLLSLSTGGEPIVDVATNGEVTLYVPVSEASKEFWCLLSKWAQEERAFLAQHPLDSIPWTNRAPAWPLDLPPSGSTQRSDPFNPRP